MFALKYAFHQFLKNPGFSTVAVLTLALGIGLEVSCGAQPSALTNFFVGAQVGAETTIGGIRLCWCPAGKL